MEFTLPWPPSVNGYWRNFRGRQIISKRGREFREAAVSLLSSLDEKTIDYPVSVSIHYYPPTKRAFDLDNFSKGILDAMQHSGLLEDDSLVHELHLYKEFKDPPGRAEVTVTPM
jgi:crossover junction endodeoxyribonuclease RusA